MPHAVQCGENEKRVLIKLRWLRAFSLGGHSAWEELDLLNSGLDVRGLCACGALWVWSTVWESLEHPWIWVSWAGDFLEPAPHGVRGDWLEQRWETGN